MPSEHVRPPAVAGRFYPAEPERLAADVRHYLNAAQAPEDCLAPPMVKAVIVPHAGYVYSGPIAASAYLHLACSDIPVQRFVLVGPAHFAPVSGLATSSADAFETPLGRVPIDIAGREAALASRYVHVDDLAHRPEHCLEVQLPFLQMLFPDFTIIPLLVGDAEADEVADVLARLWGGPDTRIVISSDLSHYYSGAVARQLDAETARLRGSVRHPAPHPHGRRDGRGHRRPRRASAARRRRLWAGGHCRAADRGPPPCHNRRRA